MSFQKRLHNFNSACGFNKFCIGVTKCDKKLHKQAVI